MKSKNTIELNGKLYDAVTGRMMGAGSVQQTKTGGNIDGFFRGRATSPTMRTVQKISVVAAPAAAPKPPRAPGRAANHAQIHRPQASKRLHDAASSTHAVPVVKHPKTVQVSVNHARAHQPQPAITLMRTAVKRPNPSLKQQVNVQGALAHSVPSLIAVKRSAQNIDEDRMVRAGNVATNPLIAHHGAEPRKVSFAVTPLAVQPVPVKPEVGEDTAPKPLPGNNPKPQDMFEHALINAANFIDVKTHRAHFRKQTRRHVASMAAGTLALLVIAGFATYQNSPGLQLKVASVQAGVSTGMPDFGAAGFAYNGVKAGNGKLVVGFSGKSGDYQLTQQTTSWSSSDMIQDVSSVDASGHPNYTTVQAGSTTVYRFNNTNAMWVSGGKWYNVTGTGALSNDQVKSLVENV